ncbi:MAG TPA: signal peptide peptidase SppA [Ignavibacteria bacterium]|nr:signal peptide peptidase SppA [Bacteroidota bacterium]HRI84754.1 signal peptide peptidase SppA [Ignavibacteria bacterium]HRJ98183.1 signal peptide peptidase SppA [Ignavibacteria bacterium]
MDNGNQQPAKSNSGKWFWGIFISLIVIAIIFVGISFIYFTKAITDTDGSLEISGKGKGKIAVVELNFTIFSSEGIVKQFKKYSEDKSIKAILLRVNTPGGGVAASQEIYEIIRKTRDGGKPVIVSIASLGASGGYYAACGGSTIIADEGSLVGSIGVIIQLINYKELADKIGVKSMTITSGELKDAGNPFNDFSEKDRTYFQEIVDDTYQQFIEVVARERKIDTAKIKEYATGRVFTGRQALKIGLIDSIGTYEDAIKIAADMAGIEGEPTIVKEKNKTTLFERILDTFSNNELRSIKEEIKSEFIDQPLLQYKFVY